jgi:para-nitrobenzyl esterase
MKTPPRFLLPSLYFFIIALIASCSINNTPNTLVKTTEGTMSGVLTAANDVAVFKGVPFAAPPVGDLRWQPPMPPTPWDGVRKCDKWPASPMQGKPVPFRMWTEEFIAPPEPLSEDCLYLNIWTSAKSENEKLPVLVWIYGGGFVSGSGACAVYDGEDIARQGVVYITINYRVGIFGFMAHPELTNESKNKNSGNYGLMDQQAALAWIQKNISAFGGDPSRVTIAGQSAGSMSVNALVASPLSKGLLHGAIAQSGGMMSDRFSKTLLDGEAVGAEVMKMLNLSSIAEMRHVPADTLLKIASKISFGGFGPIIDGYVLPGKVKDIIQNDKHNQVPMLSGWVAGDGGLMGGDVPTADSFVAFAKENYGADVENFLKAFPASTDEEAKSSRQKLNLMEFAAFPSRVWAEENDKPVYLYHFSHVPTDKPDFPNYGAFHTSEVPYALHTLKKWNRPWAERDYKMEKTMNAYWINFAKTGNPNGDVLPEWKNYESGTGSIMEFNEGAELKAGMFNAEFKVLMKKFQED